MSDRSINLNQTEAFAQILPSAPQLSSHKTGWSDFFLAYYQQHPGCESPKSIFRQHALEIIDSGFESSHERYLEVQHLAYRLQGGETCFCPANTSHWTKKINERRLEVMNKCPKGLASRRNQTRISRGFSLIIDDSGHRKSGCLLRPIR